MTKINYWYKTQTKEERQKFRQHLTDKCGIDETTVYRYLVTEPPKLTKELISEYTKIPQDQLYKPLKLIP